MILSRSPRGVRFRTQKKTKKQVHFKIRCLTVRVTTDNDKPRLMRKVETGEDYLEQTAWFTTHSLIFCFILFSSTQTLSLLANASLGAKDFLREEPRSGKKRKRRRETK